MPPSSTPGVINQAEEEIITSVGPGAIPRQHEQQPSLLDAVTEYEWVDLLNPLSMTFIAQVASSRPVNAPVKIAQTPGLQSGVRTEADLATQYGITGFKNPAHPSNVHVPHTIQIAPGVTRRFPGNEAQVVLRQLVGYVLQVEGKGLKLADPYERNKMEQRIIRGKGLIQDLMETSAVSVRDQLTAAVDKSNTNMETSHAAPNTPEPEFPDANGSSKGSPSPQSVGVAEFGDNPSPKV